MIIRDILLTISILDLSCTAFGRYFLFTLILKEYIAKELCLVILSKICSILLWAMMNFREIQIKPLTEHLFCDRIDLHSEG